MDNASRSGYEQYQQSCFQTGDNIKEVNACSEKSFDAKEDQVDLLNSHEASTPFSINRALHGHEAVPNHLSGTNSTAVASTTTHLQAFDKAKQRDNNTPTISARDLEAFGRYLGPHRLLHQQVNANSRQQLFGFQSGVRNLSPGDADVISQLNPISSGVNKPIISSSGAGGNHSGKQLSETFIQDHRVLGENNSGTIPKEQSQINFQMGSSWFRQYGTLINGQMLPVPDQTHTVTSEKQLSDGKNGEAFQLITSIGLVDPSNASQVSGTLPNLDMKKVTSPRLSSQFSLPWGNIEQNLAVLRPKKRKVAAFDLLPWHKEVTQSLQQLHKFSSMAEAEWALASNRLTEKVEDEAEIMEDVSPSSQAKKRLALTTKLMQQIFRPALKVILSADASTNRESMVYFAARLALGDACSMTSGSHKRPLTSDTSSKEMTTAEKVGQLDSVRAVEDFNDRAKRLENDLLRLEKSASVVDIKVDSQDLEKFSVINRFAKFHTRANGASSVSSASPAKPVPQRYVVAHPMPKAVPEGTNCISL